MSSATTDREARRRRQSGPLKGVGGVVAAATLLLVIFAGWLVLDVGMQQDATHAESESIDDMRG